MGLPLYSPEPALMRRRRVLIAACGSGSYLVCSGQRRFGDADFSLGFWRRVYLTSVSTFLLVKPIRFAWSSIYGWLALCVVNSLTWLGGGFVLHTCSVTRRFICAARSLAWLLSAPRQPLMEYIRTTWLDLVHFFRYLYARRLTISLPGHFDARFRCDMSY